MDCYAIDFPASPVAGDVYTYGGRTWSIDASRPCTDMGLRRLPDWPPVAWFRSLGLT